MPGQRQAFDDFFLAQPVHAELVQLRLGLQRALAIVFNSEKLPHRVRLLFRQGLAHVQPVGIHHRFQRAELVGQLLCAARAHRGDVQLVEEPAQGGAGGEFGAQFALVLNLQAVLEQFGDDLAVVRVLEEAVDLVCHFQADVRQVRQHLRQGLLHALQGTQGARQDLGRLFADIGNAEGVDETRQARLLAVFDGAEEFFARQLGKAFEVDDVLELEGIQICRRAHQPFVDQLFDALVAQAFDVHGTARDEVDDRLLELCATGQATDAAIHRALTDRLAALAALDQLGALDVRATHRALLGNLHRPGVFGAALGDDLHHLRNHVARAADNHGIADHQPQSRDFVHVVQGRIGHGNTRDLDRFQARHRGDRAGASDLELDVEQFRELFHRREFVRDGPARLARTEAQLTLGGDAVDLEYHAVDFVSQAVATFADVAVVIQAFVDTVGQLQLAADWHAPLLQLLEVADVGVGDVGRDLADAITAEFQRTVGGDLRIQLAQAASGGIARVGEGFAADFQLSGVEPLEAGFGHEHFATDFQGRRPAAALQLERDVAHGAHVDADVFTGRTVATRRAAHQYAILIQQADRQTIELGLTAIFNRRTAAQQVTDRQIQTFGDPTIKLTHVGFFKGVTEAEHRHFMTHLGERRQCRAANALGGRVAGDQFRMRGFKGLELVEQAIVLRVRNARLIHHVIAIVVLIELGAQL